MNGIIYHDLYVHGHEHHDHPYDRDHARWLNRDGHAHACVHDRVCGHVCAYVDGSVSYSHVDDRVHGHVHAHAYENVYDHVFLPQSNSPFSGILS